MKITLPAYAVANESFILSNSSSCRRNLEVFATAINNRESWSMKMLDSSGIPKPGFYYGNKFWLGVKSQCLSLHNNYVENNYPPFEVNYFAAYFYYDLETTKNNVLTLGLCLPNICTNDELSLILRKIFNERNLMMSDIYEVDYTFLRVSDLKTNYHYLLNWKSIIIELIIFFTILMMIFGSIYDVRRRKGMKKLNSSNAVLTYNNDSPRNLVITNNNISNDLNKQKQNIFGEIVLCFSVYTNTKLLLNTKKGSDSSLKSIHGIKFIAMVFVIFFHTKQYTDCSADNTYYYTKGTTNLLVEIIDRSSQAVNVFFFLSGFLIVYNLYSREIKNKLNGKEPTKPTLSSLFEALYKRYLRLTPAYMMTMGITYICFSHFDDVSQLFIPTNVKFHHSLIYGGSKENCDNYWWTHLLYINNLFNFNEMCITWGWYLANDMQFFIIGYIITTYSVVYFYSSAAFWTILMVSTTIVSGYVSYSRDYFLSQFISMSEEDLMYKLPWMRIGPYLIGMAVAYYLIQMKDKINLNKINIWILWILAPTALIGSIWFHKTEFSILEMAFYVAVFRSIWGLSIGWIVFASVTGYGGFVNTFLSREIFVVLGRLTYCAYLVNPTIVFLSYFDADEAIHADIMLQLPMFLGIVVLTFFGAFIFYLMFETPYISLLRVLTTKSKYK
ncbi:Hypothetical protein CINCED_3A011760 [Cinara cedri]|nr:Hypothetical protein CINCED_3A011760 [Cinara cedri]